MQGRERAINTLSVRTPQSHNTNPSKERRENCTVIYIVNSGVAYGTCFFEGACDAYGP